MASMGVGTALAIVLNHYYSKATGDVLDAQTFGAFTVLFSTAAHLVQDRWLNPPPPKP